MAKGKRSDNGGGAPAAMSAEKAAQRIAVILAKVATAERKHVVKRANAILRFANKMASSITVG